MAANLEDCSLPCNFERGKKKRLSDRRNIVLHDKTTFVFHFPLKSFISLSLTSFRSRA